MGQEGRHQSAKLESADQPKERLMDMCALMISLICSRREA